MTNEPVHYIKPQNLAELLGIRDGIENLTLEVKRATGKEGKGEIPSDFYPTYSAFANTLGGIVVLGLEEKNSRGDLIYKIAGIQNPDKLIEKLSSDLNNNTKVSKNCVTPNGIEKIQTGDAWIIIIRIEKADRTEKPVYLNGNPINNTYIRRASGDCLASEEEVRFMIQDAASETLDSKILPNYTPDDFDTQSVLTYRNLFRITNPSHPWNSLDDTEFLKRIKAYRTDRDSNTSGITKAGLLMFGNVTDIRDYFPSYYLDYIEKHTEDASVRYDNKISSHQGTWSGNIFDFFREIDMKLSEGLEVPFRLSNRQRIDENPVSEVLREALVNTLIHADYTGAAPVKIEKYPDRFVFSNPGNMRRPLPLAREGGVSDCRNRILQSMFHHIGYGDQEGFGICTIFEKWTEETGSSPEFSESEITTSTKLVLRRTPSSGNNTSKCDTQYDLEGNPRRFSQPPQKSLDYNFVTTNETSEFKSAAATARGTTSLILEKEEQLKSISSTALLGKSGTPNGISSASLSSKSDVPNGTSSASLLGKSEPPKGISSVLLSDKKIRLKTTENERETLLSSLSPATRTKIDSLGKRASPETMCALIREICACRESTTDEIALILNRKKGSAISNRYISKLLNEGKLERTLPDKPTSPNQKYRAVLTAKNPEKKK